MFILHRFRAYSIANAVYIAIGLKISGTVTCAISACNLAHCSAVQRNAVSSLQAVEFFYLNIRSIYIGLAIIITFSRFKVYRQFLGRNPARAGKGTRVVRQAGIVSTGCSHNRVIILGCA